MYRWLHFALPCLLAVLLCLSGRASASVSIVNMAPANGAAPAQLALYRFAPVARWVEPHSPDYRVMPREEQVSDGSYYVLLDRQFDVGERGSDAYSHHAVKVVNASGVDEESEINLHVDPSHETLDIHSLRIVRSGAVIDQLPVARIVALPEETSLQARIYDGSYKINIILSDVRIGDIVEYAYTVHSADLLFPGHFSTTFSVAWSSALHEQHVRVRYPADRTLRYRLAGDEAVPQLSAKGSTRELRFAWKDQPAVDSDDDQPDWYEPWAYLELSDLDNWAQVAQRVSPLFERPGSDRKGLEPWLKEIRAAAPDPALQAQAALQLVQERIRYTSISIGRNSHQPAMPSQVLERGFGDCKDKSLLLISLLRELGLKADVALVHSDRGRILPELLPTPYAFDHAIVRLSLGDHTYWLDPTRSKELGALDSLLPADFENALIVDAGTAALTAMPRPAPDAYRREVETVMDLSAGFDKLITMDVISRYHGASANSRRASLETGKRSQRGQDYLNYYARYYPGLSIAKPHEIIDDPVANVLEIHEYYRLEHGIEAQKNGRRKIEFNPDELYDFGRPVDDSVRSSPLALDYPVDIEYTIVARLPKDWDIKPDVQTVENSAFRYRSEVAYAKRELRLKYHYQALVDSVPVEALEGYLHDRAVIYDDMGYHLTTGTPNTKPDEMIRITAIKVPSVAPLSAASLSALFGLLLGWIAAHRLIYRYDPPARAAAYAGAAAKDIASIPIGIGGWLLLAALSVVLTLPSLIFLLWKLVQLGDPAAWSLLIAPLGDAVHAISTPLLHIALVLVAMAVPLTAAQALLFFRKRTSAPTVFIWITWLLTPLALAISVGLDLITGKLAGELPVLAATTAYNIVAAIAWTFYMLRSKRVAATFVQRLDVKPRPPNAVWDGWGPKPVTPALVATSPETSEPQ